MFLPVAGSKLSGRPVSAETMFLESFRPHCRWSSARTVEVITKQQNNAGMNNCQSRLFPISSTGLLFNKQRLYTNSGRCIIESGNEDFFNNLTVIYLSSADMP
jgi:hypothetical protein